MTDNNNQILNATQLKLANEILAWLLANSDKDHWSERIEEMFPGTEYETVMASLERTMNDLAITRPVSVFVGSTATLKESSGSTGDDAQLAIQALKDNNRILQLGRGRGRVIVVLSHDVLTEGSTYKIKHSVSTQAEPMVATASTEASMTW